MNCAIFLTEQDIQVFCAELIRRERSAATVAQYRCSLLQLWNFLPEEKRLSRESLLEWKQKTAAHKAVRTVNCMIAAVNAYLEFWGAEQLKLKSLKCQRKTFCEDELTQDEFQSLVTQAWQEGDEQTALLLNAMSGSGVRVSEVRFLTVEAVNTRMAIIRLKGKTRQIPLGDKLCRELLRYAQKQGIEAGPLFLGKNGRPLDRRRIWERMKKLCDGAGVDAKKVHPHALRHLFARAFYEFTRDLAKLADLLGHGSIETTRIYVVTSVREHRAILDKLDMHLNAKKPPNSGGFTVVRT